MAGDAVPRRRSIVLEAAARAVLLLPLVFVACARQVHGQIRIDGSSTVFPISEAMAEEFSKETRVRVNVAFSGTGGGFAKFCRGEIQVSNASRPIKERER